MDAIIFKIIAIVAVILCISSPVNSMGVFSNEKWTLTGKKPKQNDMIQITLAIQQVNTEWLKTTLASVSDPDSSEYGKYISLSEITKYVYGNPQSVLQVKEYLRYHRLDPAFTLGEGFATFDISIATAERLFEADFNEFQNNEYKELLVVRSKGFTIPKPLVNCVDFVAGINDFPSTLHRKKHFHQYSNKPIRINDDGDTTPQSIDKAYNLSGYSSTSIGNSQAIASFLGQYFNPSDLEAFQKQYNISLNPISRILGPNEPKSPGMEATLDVEYITSIGRNVETWFMSVSNRANGKQEDFITWLMEIVNSTYSPWVHSVSYGDYESTIDPKYMARTEDEFMKIGISGRSLLFASGDDGTSCSLHKGGVFEPMWPASSPHVTTVGGTVSMTECWDHSGGGFSNVFETPSYQKPAIYTYLQNAKSLPNKGHFNTTGRGYPDLSVFSTNYAIVILGVPWPVDGTSCATPTTAGIISLLNDVRLKKGLTTLGFLNPLLYKLYGEGFTDITQGTNRGKAWCKGFTASKGWDPTSGWGSPNFALLKNLV